MTMLSEEEMEESNRRRFDDKYNELADLFCEVLKYVDENYACVPEIEESVKGFTNFRERYYDKYGERKKARVST